MFGSTFHGVFSSKFLPSSGKYICVSSPSSCVVRSRYSFREFYPQNSWPSFGTYVCVNSVILDVPGRHSINIAVSSTFRLHNSRSTSLRQIYLLNSSRLPFRKHICIEFVFSIRGPHLLRKYIYVSACFSKCLDRHSKNIYFPFRWWKWTAFRRK